MASDQNQVNVTGNLTRDAEVQYTNSGSMVCKFSVAVNHYAKKRNGDGFDKYTDFIDCELWGDRKVDYAQQYLLKGQRVHISGGLKQERWESDGQKRSKVIIRVFSVLPITAFSAASNQSGVQGHPQGQRPSGATGAPATPHYQEGNVQVGQNAFGQPPGGGQFEDDIPF